MARNCKTDAYLYEPEDFPMTSPKTRVLYQDDLFRMSLSNLCASNHLLMVLASNIQWVLFDGSYCVDKGHPVLPTQMMVGLNLTKHERNLLNEGAIRLRLEKPYTHYFGSESCFQKVMPLDSGKQTRFCGRIEKGEVSVDFAGYSNSGLGGEDAEAYANALGEVEYISKWKAHKRYEFRVKVGVACQVEQITDTKMKDEFVDRGYRRHSVTDAKVYISGQMRVMRHEYKAKASTGDGTGDWPMKVTRLLNLELPEGIEDGKMNVMVRGVIHNMRIILRQNQNFLHQTLKTTIRNWTAVQNRICPCLLRESFMFLKISLKGFFRTN